MATKAIAQAFAEAQPATPIQREGDLLWVDNRNALLWLHPDRGLHLDLYFHMDLTPAAAAQVALVAQEAARRAGLPLHIREHYTLDEKDHPVYESEMPECKECGQRHPPEENTETGEAKKIEVTKGPEGMYR
ncbi:MAG: hypothetical protein HY558_07735 [Euryarchaeota archaeon]|nr:hypothetical protein [Euryarchaeota archaeon]